VLSPTITSTYTPTPQPPGELQARFGKGEVLFYTFSPDGEILAVLTPLGIYLYGIPYLGQRAYIPVRDVERIFYDAAGQLSAVSLRSGAPDLVFSKATQAGLEAYAQIAAPGSQSGLYQVSPDGALVAVMGSVRDRLEIWQIDATGQLAAGTIEVSKRPTISSPSDPSLVFSPDSDQVAYCDGYNRGGNVTVLTLSADGLETTFSLSLADLVPDFETYSGQVPEYEWYTYQPGEQGIGLAISPDGKTLVTGGPDNKVRVWDMAAGKLIATLENQNWNGAHVAYSPDGSVLTVVSDEALYLYTTWDWKLLSGSYDTASARALTPGGGEIAFSPNGSLAATLNVDRIYLVNLRLGARGGALSGFIPGPLLGLAISRDGSTLAIQGGTQEYSIFGTEIYLYDLSTQEARGRIDVRKGELYDMALSPDGQYLAATLTRPWIGEGYAAGWAQIWRVGSGASIQELDLSLGRGENEYIGGLTYSPDGRLLAIGVWKVPEWSVELWQVNEDGTATYQEDAPIDGMLFSPDSRTLFSASGSDIIAWDLDTRRSDFTATGHDITSMQIGDAASLGWQPGLKWVAVAIDRHGQVFAARGGVTEDYPPLQSVEGDGLYIISPDIKWVAAGGSGCNCGPYVQLWNLADGRIMGRVPASGGYFPGTGVIFSTDGRLLLVLEKDGTVAIWKLK
jgi:WD40 repeat protein